MKRIFPLMLLVAGGLIFAFGLVWMLQVRLETGDVYPPYSSLRSDPLGTMALYESLERLPGLDVSRDYRMTNSLPTEPGTVYLHLGADWSEWESMPADSFAEIQAFVSRGGRLVVVLNPVMESHLFDREKKAGADAKKSDNPDKNDSKGDKEGKANPPPKPASKPDDHDSDAVESVSLKDKWGLGFDFADLPYSDKGSSVSVDNVSGLKLPVQLDWSSGLYFTNLDPAWQVIYQRGKDAVVVERHFGPGTVVMATDAYFMSNEALRKDRHPDLLAWLMGAGRRVVFDEAHFGIVESPGVAGLIRRYHLVGLVGSFILLAGLFIWKNLSSLVPTPDAGPAAGYVAGRAAATGFVNLLRRNIPAGELLETCFAEWKKSPAAARPGIKLAEVQSILDEEQARPARQRDAVRAYTRIVEILRKPAFSSAPPSTLTKPPSLS